MFYRFRIETPTDNDKPEVSFTEWREEHPLSNAAEAEKINVVNQLRAANLDAAISIERSQSKPENQT
jgi:hypothetical protein